MKRTFACIGASALITMCALMRMNAFAIKAVFITAFVAFFISLAFKKVRENATLSVISFTVCVCCLLFVSYENSVNKKIDGLDNRQNTHHIVCEISALPVADNGRVYYTVKTEEIDGKKNVQKIRLSFKEYINVSPYDRLEGDFHLYKLGSLSDEIESYYNSKGLFLGGYPDKNDNIKISDRISFHPMYYILKAKQFVIDTVFLCVSNEYGGLLTGFLLGEKSAVSDKTLNAFSLIGSYHLLAVSGLHITVWTGFLYSLLRALRLKRKLCNLLPVLFILFFMAITGFNPPVVRAGLLMGFVFLGRLFDKEADSINSIGFAVTVLILINPYSAFSKSLWLSVFASLGIILLSGKIYNAFSKNEPKNSLLRVIKEFTIKSLSVSISVTAFTLPLTVIFFDRFSLVTPLANFVLIEISSFAMLFAGFGVLFFAFGLYFISYPLFFAASFLAKIITSFASLLSGIPSITVGTDWFPLAVFAWLVPVIAALLYFLKKKNKVRLFRALTLAVAFAFLTVCVTGIISEKRRTRIYIPAVGNGMSVVLVYGNNSSVIGCGGNYFAYSSFCAIMGKEGIARLDFLFVPTNDKSVYSFYDDVRSGFEIGLIKECEFGHVELNNGISVECREEYAFINCLDTSVLILFNPDFDTALLPGDYSSADYLFARGREPSYYEKDNFSSVIVVSDNYDGNKSVKYAGNEILYLEVEQNGRARLETANQR